MLIFSNDVSLLKIHRQLSSSWPCGLRLSWAMSNATSVTVSSTRAVITFNPRPLAFQLALSATIDFVLYNSVRILWEIVSYCSTCLNWGAVYPALFHLPLLLSFFQWLGGHCTENKRAIKELSRPIKKLENYLFCQPLFSNFLVFFNVSPFCRRESKKNKRAL